MFYFFTNILCLSLVIFAIFIHNYVSIYTKILWYFLFNIVMLCKVPACGYLDGALLSDFDMVWDTDVQSDFFLVFWLWFFLDGHVVVHIFYIVLNTCTCATLCHTINSRLSSVRHGLVGKIVCDFERIEKNQDFIIMFMSW